MSFLTKLPGVPDSSDAYPGMAFFPGTGPAGKMCGHCQHRGLYKKSKKAKYSEKLKEFVYKTVKTNQCAMFKKLSGGAFGATVNFDYPSCKYFEEIKK